MSRSECINLFLMIGTIILAIAAVISPFISWYYKKKELKFKRLMFEIRKINETEVFNRNLLEKIGEKEFKKINGLDFNEIDTLNSHVTKLFKANLDNDFGSINILIGGDDYKLKKTIYKKEKRFVKISKKNNNKNKIEKLDKKIKELRKTRNGIEIFNENEKVNEIILKLVNQHLKEKNNGKK